MTQLQETPVPTTNGKLGDQEALARETFGSLTKNQAIEALPKIGEQTAALLLLYISLCETLELNSQRPSKTEVIIYQAA